MPQALLFRIWMLRRHLSLAWTCNGPQGLAPQIWTPRPVTCQKLTCMRLRWLLQREVLEQQQLLLILFKAQKMGRGMTVRLAQTLA
mmetsp:Transcript_22223/g.63084  ORF Transcript_22223/g.63084 Transcript_22223/m.63084 type:complete len:86 (+) Transcript_22223:375-632(+)